MANHSTVEATIAMLERSIEEAEAKVRALRTAINTICAESGLPARYAEEHLTAGQGGRLVQIQDDTFYGKKQTTAMREYLEMRKAQGLGPAKPREIYDALVQGGLRFETKDAETALISLRALLRTQPNVFHKLPQGAYGLLAWYPEAKRSKDSDAEPREKKGASKKRKTRSAKAPSATVKHEPPLKVVEPTGAPKNQKAA